MGIGTWVGSTVRWIATGESGKLSGAPEDEPTRRALAYGAGIDSAGQTVNEKTTLGLPAAWACVRLKSGVVGSMGMGVFEKAADGSRKARSDHWLYDLVHEEPNRDQTAAEFWSGQVAAMDLWGNAYAEKETLGSRVTALTPLPPHLVQVTRNRAGERVYLYADRGKTETLPSEKIFHLRGLTLGGDVGLSAIEYGRRTLGGAMAANKTAADTFRSGLQLAGFMETAGTKLSPEQRADLIAIFDAFTGDAMRGRIVPLEKDFKFAPLKMNPAEVQLLESRAWDIEEICRWFDMLPMLIGHAAKGQTMWGSGIEQLLLGWQTLKLNPLLTNIQQAVKKQLLPMAERKRIYPEINREALMAADSAARAALYSAFGQNGVMSREEMRAKENMPEKPTAGFLTVQSNLVALDQLGAVNAPEQGARAALMNLLFGGDAEAMIDARVKALMGQDAGPRLEE
ncbi:HK97 family phage portal protein [Novosphingobium chloroacetimidivorans]|uniref:HK97 family phage portal protein n=1 Tax=Novosphingobium chloroacetimidivorans TaxID=1428314 RepID=A0A7W7K6L0_9SPHN|nr:phage portal protein [Novosphingobium chloroacetimidivorans]MBB4857189.1 HK97 family phage portal protein [Novosphingobium chloroacetimidivorans]